MRLITYNVNGLAPRLPRVLALLEEHQPDVACLQETKCAPAAFPHDALSAAGYVAADHSGGRWEGVAVLAREELGVGDTTTGFPGEPDPSQARWVETTVGEDLRVASVYVPNGRVVGSETFAEKLVFLERMRARTATLAAGPAIVAGDMNVCPTDLDVWSIEDIHGATHITPEERSRLRAVLDDGYSDAFRRLHPDETGFTWWDYRAGHFHKGFGLRIDLVLLSTAVAGGLTRAKVDRAFRKPTRVPESKPSDHAPLVVDLG